MKKRTKSPKRISEKRIRKSGGDLVVVFDEVHGMMTKHTPPFKAGRGQIRAKRDFHLIVPEPVVVAPNAYGGKPQSVAMASLILQKDFVGFYYLPVYVEPGVKQKLRPELTKLLKGKSCFHLKALTPEVCEGIREALEIGVKCFRERAWV